MEIKYKRHFVIAQVGLTEQRAGISQHGTLQQRQFT